MDVVPFLLGEGVDDLLLLALLLEISGVLSCGHGCSKGEAVKANPLIIIDIAADSIYIIPTNNLYYL